MNPLETYIPAITTVAAAVLSISILVTLARALIGPRMSDRIVAINMIGTQAICLIAVLILRQKEDWLVDIAIVYAMFNFLAVAVLTKMDIGVYRQWRDNQRSSRAWQKQSRSEAVQRREEKQQRREQK